MLNFYCLFVPFIINWTVIVIDINIKKKFQINSQVHNYANQTKI